MGHAIRLANQQKTGLRTIGIVFGTPAISVGRASPTPKSKVEFQRETRCSAALSGRAAIAIRRADYFAAQRRIRKLNPGSQSERVSKAVANGRYDQSQLSFLLAPSIMSDSSSGD